MDVDNISGYKLFLGGNADAIFFFCDAICFLNLWCKHFVFTFGPPLQQLSNGLPLNIKYCYKSLAASSKSVRTSALRLTDVYLFPKILP